MRLLKLRRLATWAPVFGLALSLSACQGFPGPRYIPAGIKQVEVKETVVVPGGSGGIYFQDGALVRQVDTDKTYCEFEVAAEAPRPSMLLPDTFIVTRGGTAILSDPEARLPLVGSFADAACGDRVFYEVDYRLSSERQPTIHHLRCSRAFTVCVDTGRYPSRQDIEQALGSAVSIR